MPYKYYKKPKPYFTTSWRSIFMLVIFASALVYLVYCGASKL